jgi:hypothetical protein
MKYLKELGNMYLKIQGIVILAYCMSCNGFSVNLIVGIMIGLYIMNILFESVEINNPLKEINILQILILISILSTISSFKFTSQIGIGVLIFGISLIGKIITKQRNN